MKLIWRQESVDKNILGKCPKRNGAWAFGRIFITFMYVFSGSDKTNRNCPAP